VIKELIFIRSIACLGVVLIHAISLSFVDFGIRKDPEYQMINILLFVIQILLMFGTPIFVFISEFILAYKYKEKTPKGFLWKRVKFILFPYVTIGVLFVLINAYENGVTSISEILINIGKTLLFGGYHGYFVLIIFQFYLLHILFTKYVGDKFKAKHVIGFSLVVNVLYLSVFNFIIPVDVSWYNQLVLPFLGWFAYFTIAYYCGRNFDEFKLFINKNKKVILIAPIITGLIVLFMCYSGILTPIQSKRVDMIFYTISIALFLFYVGSHLSKIPDFLIKISQYSFGIYLLHPIFQGIFSKFLLKDFTIFNLIINTLVYLVVGLVLPSILIVLLNKSKYGAFIVGKIGIGTKKQLLDKQIARTS